MSMSTLRWYKYISLFCRFLKCFFNILYVELVLFEDGWGFGGLMVLLFFFWFFRVSVDLFILIFLMMSSFVSSE